MVVVKVLVGDYLTANDNGASHFPENNPKEPHYLSPGGLDNHVTDSFMRRGAPPVLPSDYNYTPYYCEENIYLLADSFHRDKSITDDWEVNVVFVSNDTKTVALWSQKQSQDPDYPVVWDYHCILVLKPRSSLELVTEAAWVYDYDSCLAIPCCWSGECRPLPHSQALNLVLTSIEYSASSDYVQTTFRLLIPEQYRRFVGISIP